MNPSLRISGNIYHFASLQQFRWQKIEREVRFEKSPSLNVVSKSQRIVQQFLHFHSFCLGVLRSVIDHGITLNVGDPDQLRRISCLYLHIVHQHPDSLYGPGGSTLRIGEYPDIIFPNMTNIVMRDNQVQLNARNIIVVFP